MRCGLRGLKIRLAQQPTTISATKCSRSKSPSWWGKLLPGLVALVSLSEIMTDGDEDEDDEEDERVTAHSYGALEALASSTSECWLIRIPAKLAETLASVPDGTEIGKLLFTKGGPRTQQPGKPAIKPSFTVHLSESLTTLSQQSTTESTTTTTTATTTATDPTSLKKPAALPLNYSLQAMTKKIPTMHPFVRNPKNGSVKLLGTVTRTANLQVEQGTAYRTLLKDRLVATNITSSRFVKSVDATDSIMSKQQQQRSTDMATGTNNRSFGNAVYQVGQRKLGAAAAELETAIQPVTKKARQFAPDENLKSVLFELFGQQQYWTVKDIKSAAVAGGATAAGTKRAEAEIRDILREIGDYHRSGDQKNMWELRKEFQQQT